MNRRWAMFFLAVCAILATDCGVEQLVNSRRFHEDFRYSYDFKSGGRLYVENENGAIEITGWDRETAEITGTKYAATQEGCEALKIDVTAAADSIRVRTVRPSGHRTGMSVKYVIHVPRRISIERVESTNGSIRVEGVEGAARVQTVNGSVHVSGQLSGLEAITTNGSVEAALDAPPTERVELRTTNGSVTATMPEGLAGHLEATTTNGSVRSDFDVKGTEETRRTQLTGTIGAGGPTVRLSTTNGSVRLVKAGRAGAGAV